MQEAKGEQPYSPKRAKRRPWWQTALRWIGEFAIYLLIAILVVTLVRIFLVQNFTVPSGSMEQTLQVDDTIVAWKPGTPQRGDIVVFRDDLVWLSPTSTITPTWKKVLSWLRVLPPQDEQYLVKRLIGLPGDHVVCCDVQGRITINGHPLDEVDYLYYRSADVAQKPFHIVVPEGRMFVMGDHRDQSKDSRAMLCGGQTDLGVATPSLDSVQGTVFAIMRPFSRAQTFKIPATFADVPDPTESPPSLETADWGCP